jgi:shikimate dehydrogenase
MSTVKPRRACIVGWPVKQSRSPKLHGYWLKRYGIDGAYGAEEQSPETFDAFLLNLEARGYVGCNVTMPHKERAFALSKPDARAVAVGASNTVWIANGALHSTNTDVDGFIHGLDARAPGWDARTDVAVVLGAGGAGRAVVCGFVERGIKEIHVVNRSAERAVAMRTWFGSSVHAASWDDLPRLLKGAGLLANTTSMGMAATEPMPPLDLAAMQANAVVGDAIYVPLVTPLLAAAKRQGLVTMDGLDMLLYQAVRGFEQWFGTRPEVTQELRDVLVADITRE